MKEKKGTFRYRVNGQIYKFLDYLGEYSLAALFCLSMVYAMTTSLMFDYSPFVLYGIIFVLLLLFSLSFRSKVTIALSCASLLMITVSAGIYIHKRYPSGEYLKLISVFPDWVRQYTSTGAPFIPLYALILTALICIAVSLPAYFFIISNFNFLIVLSAGVFLFVIQWAAEYFVSYSPFYIFLFVIIVYYFRYIYLKSSSGEKSGSIPLSLFSICLIPLCALILCAAALLPASEKPIEWPWLDEKVITAINSAKSRFTYQTFDRFSLESAGFYEGENRLGGKVKNDKTPVLKVDAPQRVYLKGSVKDVFDGMCWKSSSEKKELLDYYSFDTSDISSPYFDTLELETGLFLATGDPHFPDMHMKEKSINIRFLNLKTSSLFIPAKVSAIEYDDKNFTDIFHSGNGILYLQKPMGKGFEYTVKMRSVDFKNDSIKSILAKSHRGFIDEACKLIKKSYSVQMLSDGNLYVLRDENEDFLYIRNDKPVLLTKEHIDALRNNSREIYSKYLQLPDTLSERVKQLAYSISFNTGNDYEAVKAIESFLSSNFRYTLHPKSTPAGRDFVDHFLFDSREGYCTYYASAMTVLTRCIGIPARYVEGYVLPSKKDKDGTYTVTNEQAHAWVEVYFEGFGWLPFEPTSAYSTSSVDFRSSVLPSTDSPHEDFTERLPHIDNPSNIDSITDSQPAASNPSKKESLKVSMLIVLLFTVLIILLVFFTVITINLIRRKTRLKRTINAFPRQSILYIYEHMIKILTSIGFGLLPGETPLEYSCRIERNLLSISSFKRTKDLKEAVNFKKATEIFLAARYSKISMNETHKTQVYGFYEHFLVEIKSFMGKRKFWVHKNILGKL